VRSPRQVRDGEVRSPRQVRDGEVRSPRQRWLLVVIAAAVALGLAWVGPALGVMPSSFKITDAVAKANRAAGRSKPMLLDVQLRIGDGEPVASGVLATHPTGLARLELRSSLGFTERHLLQGNAYTASRDGGMLEHPRPFLPPVFLLQVTSGAALRAALASFGVDAEQAVLGRVGDTDCYVLGGRAPRTPGGAEVRQASLWVDLESYDVVQIDRSDGVRFRFGPFQKLAENRVPAWIAIDVPGQPTARLEIERVAPANAPAAAFGSDWLTAPALP
jgi:hypothetical protein